MARIQTKPGAPRVGVGKCLAMQGVSLEEMLLITEDALHPEPYSPEEVCRCLGISLKELRTQILSPNTQDGESAGERKGIDCFITHS